MADLNGGGAHQKEKAIRFIDTRVSGVVGPAGSGRRTIVHLARLSLLAAGIGAAGLVLATPGTAQAATPATVKLGSSNGFGGEVIYDGGTGNANNLRVVREGAKIAVTDAVPVTAGAGCASVSSTKVLCEQSFGGRQVMRVTAQLGDLNDRVSVEGRFVGTILAGAGNDFMLAGQKDCCGKSTFNYHGGPDFDTVSYERAVTAVTVTKDDVNNDGLIGSFGTTSQDNIRDDVEAVFGSAFADKLTGDEKFDSFFGLGGADTIDPGAGSDRVFADAGDDIIQVKDGTDDIVNGGSGTDTATVDRVIDELTSIETTK
jgi:Ca2+-binding RTX toxin-like protein